MRMNSRLPWAALIASLLTTGGVQAQAQTAPTEKRELIYCADRLSHQEREDYRAKMRAARTVAEKESLRAAHRAEMQARAINQGADYCEPPGRQQWRGKP